jgi:hypothetical protein
VIAPSAAPGRPVFAKVALTTRIACPAEIAWPLIGGFGTAGRFLGVAITLDGEEGVLGTTRRVGADIVEALVGVSRHSYTYAQTEGPMAQYAYHGCVSLEPDSATSCKLDYTIIFEQSAMSVADLTYQLDRIKGRFEGMLESMKAAAEAAAK